jgi:hypothetical protein
MYSNASMHGVDSVDQLWFFICLWELAKESVFLSAAVHII